MPSSGAAPACRGHPRPGPQLALRQHQHPAAVRFSQRKSTSPFASPTQTVPGHTVVPPAASVGMPSPTGSCSETSDYQRSTPSPRDDDWQGGLADARTGKDDSKCGDSSDQGFSDSCVRTRAGANHRLCRSASSDDGKVVIQQVRIALQKLPDLDQMLLVKRRHSESPVEAQDAKRPRLDLLQQGKITAYMTETKPFVTSAASRKEKLDKILNLKMDVKEEEAAPDSKLLLADLQLAHNPNDLFLLSQLKHLKEAQLCGSVIKTEAAMDPGEKSPSPSSEDTSDGQASTVPTTDCPSATLTEDSMETSMATVRFPASKANVVACKWQDCDTELDSTGKLLDHLRMVHALNQTQSCVSEAGPDHELSFRCLWSGCKVFGKRSCSKTWLEKHVATHCDNKPFQCILDGCKMRFGTKSLLERHVHSHLTSSKSSATTCHCNNPGPGACACGASSASGATSAASSPSQTRGRPPSGVRRMPRFHRILRLRSQTSPAPISAARMFDLFDVGVMAQLQLWLSQMHSAAREQLGLSACGQELTLTANVVARRRDANTKKNVLLVRWSPANILDDEWVSPCDFVRTRTLSVHSLSVSSRGSLWSRVMKSAGVTAPMANAGRRRKASPQNHKTDGLS